MMHIASISHKKNDSVDSVDVVDGGGGATADDDGFCSISDDHYSCCLDFLMRTRLSALKLVSLTVSLASLTCMNNHSAFNDA